MTAPGSSARGARRRGTAMFAASLTLLALTSACGLKSGATDALKSPTGAAGTTGGTVAGGPVATGTGNVGAGSTGSVGGPTSSGGSVLAGGSGGAVTSGSSTSGTGSTTSGTGTGTGGSTSSGGGAKPASGSCGVPSGGDTTGVTASTLNIGLHAPLTGTGTPFPNSSFQKGAGTFWQQPGHTVCGRKVTVEFQDDTYTPAGARNVCSQMAKRDFFVVGGGGTDQIQACATDPDIQRLGVPYLSAGVTDNGLSSLSNYFAVSLTYAQQGSLVLQNAKTHGFATPAASKVPSDNISGKNAEWAIVTGSSPNFAGARDGVEKALTQAGIPYKNYPIDQNGNYQAAATQFGQQLALNGFSTIFVDSAPGYFVFMTGGYYGAHVGTANWVGPGVTFTEVTVAQYICTSSKNAVNGHAWFLSPAPGLDHATQEFKTAYKGSYDDIEWALWGLSETLWKLLQNASGNLTRQNFIASAEASKLPAGSVYPPVDFKDNGGHFGGTGAWVQRVNCGTTEPDQNQPGGWDTVGSTYLNLF